MGWSQAHRWLPGAVDLVRNLPGVGFGRMHQLESSALGLLDALQRGDAATDFRDVSPPPPSLATLWPPAPLVPLISAPALEREGIWSPVSPGCLRGKDARSLVRTRLRVDPERPEMAVEIVGVDLTHNALHLVPGSDLEGSGDIPEHLKEETVMAFNGGFQHQHGAFGVGTEGRELIPLQEKSATLTIDEAGRVWMGAWEEAAGRGWRQARQNLQLLLEEGEVRPKLWLMADGRRETIGHSVTRRSGVCVRGPRSFFYLWTLRGRARELGLAMKALGCSRGMHLDLNAFHTTLEFLNFQGQTCSERLSPRMNDVPAGRYLRPQKRDFIVVTRRKEPRETPVLE